MTWRDRYYEVGYLKRWQLPPPSDAQLAEAKTLLALSGAENDPLSLDLGCGHGRYTIGLAGAGVRVVGLDASWALLQKARSQAHGLDQRIKWVRGDMRALPFQPVFRLVLMVDAFGYFDSDGEDLECLKGIRRVLRPGGRLVMRNPNAVWLRTNFDAKRTEERNGRTITVRSAFDAGEHWVQERITIQGDDGLDEFARRARVYTAPELENLFETAGFDSVGHFSSLDGASFHAETSGRIVTVGRASERG